MTARTHDKAEIVVVGSGIAGSTMAVELAGAGLDVLVLEGGPPRAVADMISSQMWGRRLKWGGPPVIGEGNLTGGLTFGMGWGTGGAGAHWYGHWYRHHENDFKVRSLYGRGLDWPIEYEDLRPYYDRAQRYFGVSGDSEQDVWSPSGEAYPMPPMPKNPQFDAIKKGFDAAGLRVASSSLAINSESYDGRLPCVNDGWCDAGCPIGALANPLVLQWPKAHAAGATLRNHAYVTRVTTDATGKRATGVEYYDADGELNSQPADIVIVACHTVANIRLLLLSANESHPSGLANGSGMLGHHFMSHAAQIVYGMFEEETEPYRGTTGGTAMCMDGYDDKEPAAGAFGSRTWLIGQAVKPNGLLGIAMGRPELYGDALDKFLRRAARHFGNMTVMCEETSVFENRVELDEGRKDTFGMPVAKVINELPAENVKRSEHAREEGLSVFRAADTSEVWSSARAPMHVMGGTPMGDDPSRSVTDSYGRTHDVDNLFVAGASLYPTCGAVNPTATLAALVLRTADHVRENAASLKN